MNRFEKDFAIKVMDKLRADKLTVLFWEKINPEEDQSIPDYLQVIRRPIDLSEIKENLEKGKFKSAEEWRSDVMLVWDNAIKYHEKRKSKRIADIAHHFKNKLVSKLSFIPKTEEDLWFMKIQKINRQIKKMYEFRSKSFSLTEINPINEIK